MKKFSEIVNFVRYDMWRRTTTEFDGFLQKLAYGTIRTIVLVIRGFASKNLNDKAKSLTYSLIFAIIPILAMILAVAKGFGVADVIEQQLNMSFLGETNMVPTIMAMVERYLETAQGGLFIGIGILILLWAVYSFCIQQDMECTTLAFYTAPSNHLYRDCGADTCTHRMFGGHQYICPYGAGGCNQYRVAAHILPDKRIEVSAISLVLAILHVDVYRNTQHQGALHECRNTRNYHGNIVPIAANAFGLFDCHVEPHEYCLRCFRYSSYIDDLAAIYQSIDTNRCGNVLRHTEQRGV